MYCGKCGALIRGGDSFCTSCGNKYSNNAFTDETDFLNYNKILAIAGLGDADSLEIAIKQFANEVNAHSIFSLILPAYDNILMYLEKKKNVLTEKLDKLDENEPDILSARYDSWEEKHDATETMLETIDNLLENVEEGKEHLEDLIGELPFLILDSEQYAQDDISYKSLAIALKLATQY